MEEVMHLVIKKDYAASLIKHLIQEEAVELIGDEEAVDNEITEEQKKAVLEALEQYNANPESATPWEAVKKKYSFLK